MDGDGGTLREGQGVIFDDAMRNGAGDLEIARFGEELIIGLFGEDEDEGVTGVGEGDEWEVRYRAGEHIDGISEGEQKAHEPGKRNLSRLFEKSILRRVGRVGTALLRPSGVALN